MEEQEEQARRNIISSSLVFSVNGNKFELSDNDVDPSITLLEFLRAKTDFKSVKLSCGEGGCGACVVLLSKYDPLLDKIEDYTISSCLTLLYSINGCSITTSEGLGNSKKGFHPIHQRFTEFHASQCGFCTPGMCISLYGALVNAEKTDRPEPSSGLSKLTAAEAEKSIVGNLCRCTGYRPIADACKSFASDAVDMEDLGFHFFWKKGKGNEVKSRMLPQYNKDEISTFPEFLKSEIMSSRHLQSEMSSWHQPSTFEELEGLLSLDDGARIKLVVGNTSMGYYKDHEHYDKYIDLRYIPELSAIQKDQTAIEIGAVVTISKVIEALMEENNIVFKKIAAHMDKVATKFIRNIGSIGGNLVMAQRQHFPSDIATILLGAGSFVTIRTGTISESLTLEEFLKRPPLDSKSVQVSVKIPNWTSMPESNSKLLFETYRAAPRPLGNALAYVNASFLAEVSSESSGGTVLNTCQLAYGAFGTEHAIRARETETFLIGKLLTFSVLYEAITLVKSTVVPKDGTPDAWYRSSLIVAFLFDFLGPLTNSSSLVGYHVGTSLFEYFKINENCDKLDRVKFATMLSSSEQEIPSSQDYYPVGEPIPRYGASLQASGQYYFFRDIDIGNFLLHLIAWLL
ncbi:aldehyde oxidase 1 [Euphorbia peplus]|nr:aldehyde oxidase 1 [Euphorbia peplus]